LLTAAFDDQTTIYDSAGTTRQASAPDELTNDQNNQQAYQVRGMVVHDIICDLRDFVTAADAEARQRFTAESIAFRMGSYFAPEDRIPGGRNG